MNVNLRRANSRDVERIFHLSNDPDVRAVSFQQETIPWDTHVHWFRQQLDSSDTMFFLAFRAGEPESEESFVGQVRFKVSGPQECEISLSLTSSHRGKGWGRSMVECALTQIFRETPLRRVHAQVKNDNLRSLRFFLSLGFEPVQPPSYPDRQEFVLTLPKEFPHD